MAVHRLSPDEVRGLIGAVRNRSKRLARTLLMPSPYVEANPQRTLPTISQETLAEMIDTTRELLMNKFRKRGVLAASRN